MKRAVLVLSTCLAFGLAEVSVEAAPTPAPIQAKGSIQGVVTEAKTRKKVKNALVVLQCSCLQASRETRTNENGIYSFLGLPPGTYTIQVLYGKADVSKVVTLPRDGKLRANFSIDPANEFRRSIVVESKPVRSAVSVEMDFASSVSAGRLARTRGVAASDRAGFRRMHRQGEFNTEAYQHIVDNDLLDVSDKPLSTFSIDVDTAAYANVRRFLSRGQLPPEDAVRIEEMLNYFDYSYPEPRGRHPFGVSAEVGPCPWNERRRLVRIGLRGKSMQPTEVPPRNLVFLIDVSGSMMAENKLPLVQQSLHLLVDRLRPEDVVGIVVYAGAAGTLLPPTPGRHRAKIRAAIDSLVAGGTTNGAGGIKEAYRLAKRSFRAHGINRVILATDGDFNVGVSSVGGITRLIERKRKSGIHLSVLGFGMGNLDDAIMETLADKGDGNYAYIDTLREARKVLVEEASSTLVTLAKDVKIQVEFNPRLVESYRLIGYENRKLQDRDFEDDAKDAGEIGAGHTVTALYEIVPAGEPERGRKLRYQTGRRMKPDAQGDELLHVKLRYKSPRGGKSRPLSISVKDRGRSLHATSDDFRFAAAVAELGLLLRDSKHKGKASFSEAVQLARSGRGKDPHGYRAEFVDLARQAAALSGRDSER